MTHIVRAKTRGEAWSHAVPIVGQNRDTAIILDIEQPYQETPTDRALHTAIDTQYRKLGLYPLETVASTIFPASFYWRNGMKGLYEDYLEAYPTIKLGDPGGWGTYAERLLRVEIPGERGEYVGNPPINPLEKTIEKLRKANTPERQGFRSAYELSLYRPHQDANRERRIPCLTHLSFKLIQSRIHLTAIYRLHDYWQKVPGNLLGLARLQACVAREARAEIGSLTVHSTSAYFNFSKGFGVGALRKLHAAHSPDLV